MAELPELALDLAVESGAIILDDETMEANIVVPEDNTLNGAQWFMAAGGMDAIRAVLISRGYTITG